MVEDKQCTECDVSYAHSFAEYSESRMVLRVASNSFSERKTFEGHLHLVAE